jgi:glycosyltransferase involved in cell wall biosynthesis
MTLPKSNPPGPATRTDSVPAVSVVVPCFNGGRFLDRLMTSLDAQTFRDFEILIVDDGSNDDLTAYKLAELDGRAQVIHRPNGGASAARNTGAREARADILFMLDCDDTIEPDFLAATVSALQAAPADVGMAVAHLKLVGAESGIIPGYFNRFDLLFKNTLSSGLVLRKQSWSAVGGYDESMREGYEDWEFSLRLAEAGFCAVEVARPLYIYHVVGDDQVSSISANVHAKRLYAKLWRQIRDRHPQSYRPSAMARLWWNGRNTNGSMPLWKGFIGYALAVILPDASFNQMKANLHRRRLPPETRTA